MIRFSISPAAVVLVVVLSGCQQAAPRATSEGHSTYAFIEAPAIGGRKAEVDLATEREAVDVLEAASPVEPLVLPVYPRAALAAHAGMMLVGVRISVDVDGRVTDVGPSLLSFSTPGPFAEKFHAAVEAAVWQWKFVPARRRHLEPFKGGNGALYWRAASEEKVDASFDVAFTFSADGEIAVRRAK